MDRSRCVESMMQQAQRELADRLSHGLYRVLEAEQHRLEQRTDQVVQSCPPETTEWFRQVAERVKRDMQQITEDGIRQIREIADRPL